MPLPVEIAERLDALTSATRRDDALTLIETLRRVTGLEPHLWKGIISFGEYHYRYESGHSGTAPAAGFAPRASATVIYLADGIGTYAAELALLGPHKTGVGCLYIARLDRVDVAVLESILARSFAAVTAGTFLQRARDGEPAKATD
ncbi:DUF1801 domain-containing protein [Mycetocola tolaasinivorans]|uniref:DUF1801 domain-containing protein n=1 Tax=Mycetocola tolaasinivorans TaxID=76635 RepID=A0A3L7A3J1_9MICO|nr:DUF1801 domain-containing protein [Mycetocola tolaasinivorans]RLP74101.1 DUF1801 domain-containing protein [Mycetocola tolaasinivorans]